MIRVLSVFGSLFFLASGFAQTLGVVECDGRTSISAWEAPDSIIVVEQLSCGQILPVQGVEEGYVKVRVKERVFAFVDSRYIRFIEEEDAAEQGISELETRKDSADADIPDLEAPTEPQETVPDIAGVPPGTPKREALLKSGLEVGLDSSYIRYEEPDYMKEEGATLSLYGNYTFRPRNLTLRLDGRMGFGGMHYSSPVSGTADGIRDYILEARFLLGRTLKASDKWYLTPFSGLGYRYLFDGFEGTVTSAGHSGYNRKSNYLYTPIGVESANSLTYGWSLVTSMEYDLFWHGWQYSELGGEIEELTAINAQENGWGMRGSAKFIKRTGRYDFVFGPYLKYWDIEDSNVVDLSYEGEETSVLEPANNSLEIGGMFGIRF